MSRLTKGYEKHNNEFISYVADISLYPEMMGYEQTQAEMDCINKLGTLEDLEEELGIDLITLFKALKDGIYINKKGYVNSAYEDEKFNEEDSYYNSLQLYKSYDGYFLQDTYSPYGDSECGEIGCCVALKDYGKTWALSRNELEVQDND